MLSHYQRNNGNEYHFRMYYFTLENQTFIEEGEVYDKFMPILVPDGLPCTVGESRKPGVSKNN